MRRVEELQGPEQPWFTFCPTPQVPPLLLFVLLFLPPSLPSITFSIHSLCRFPAIRGHDSSVGKLLCADVIFICTTQSDRTLKSRTKEKLLLGLSGNTMNPPCSKNKVLPPNFSFFSFFYLFYTCAKRAVAPLKYPVAPPRGKPNTGCGVLRQNSAKLPTRVNKSTINKCYCVSLPTYTKNRP